MSVSDYHVEHAFTGLFSIWMLYLALFLGSYSSKKQRLSNDNITSTKKSFIFSNIANWPDSYYFINVVICWICSILSAKFYTSRNFNDVFTGLINGSGGYAIYQKYAKEANIGAFTMAKLPYFIMLTYSTFMTIWSMVGILLDNKKKKLSQIIYVIAIMMSYLYFGVARGTNYEMYIVFISFVYCILSRKERRNHVNKQNKKRLLLVVLIGIMVVIVFRIVVEKRGYIFNNQICLEITYDSEKIVAQLFPTITTMGLAIFRYLGWGIFTIGYMKWNAMESARTILAMLIPRGQTVLYNNTWVELTKQTVSVGVGWVPDYMSLLDYLGIPLMLIIVFFIGQFYSSLKSSNNPKLLIDLLGLFLFIEMLSLPVGNFVVTSTPIVLSLFVCILWFCKANINYKRGK